MTQDPSSDGAPEFGDPRQTFQPGQPVQQPQVFGQALGQWQAFDGPSVQPQDDPAADSHGMLTPRWDPSQGPAPTFEPQQYLTPKVQEKRTWVTYLVLALLVLFVLWQIFGKR